MGEGGGGQNVTAKKGVRFVQCKLIPLSYEWKWNVKVKDTMWNGHFSTMQMGILASSPISHKV